MPKRQSLTLLSGKGGSGKTVIALSMSRVLAEAAYRVLLIDCDTSTHGATYFFESEIGLFADQHLSLTGLIQSSNLEAPVFQTRAGFAFIPSTLNPADDKKVLDSFNESQVQRLFERLDVISESFDAIIFDCQAGYSLIALFAAQWAQRSLVILEPDAVSSAALRVLHLQMGRALRATSTWQIFNKLTEEERPTYEKIFGGTLFPNLPPVPFDWQVRAAFAVCEIPSVTVKWSAFGLGVLRTMKTIFPAFGNNLEDLEYKTVGKWYDHIYERIETLKKQSNEIMYKRIEAKRQKQFERSRLITYVGMSGSLLITFFATLYYFPPVRARLDLLRGDWLSIFLAITGLVLATGFAAKFQFDMRSLRREHEQDLAQESITEIEAELSKYVTLIATDPSLREYEKRKTDNS